MAHRPYSSPHAADLGLRPERAKIRASLDDRAGVHRSDYGAWFGVLAWRVDGDQT